MADTSEPKPYQILRIEDLPMHDDVRQQFERRSQGIRQQSDSASIPTSLGLKDPSAALKNFCPKCGLSQAEPFGDHKLASRLNVHGVIVEVYVCGGVIVYMDGRVTVSTRTSHGLGTSGQLGYTRVVLTPEK